MKAILVNINDGPRETDATPNVAPARGLHDRHIQLIAIGGAIGAGLFLSSGAAIAAAGPATIFAYGICGIFVFLMARALGELALHAAPNEPFVAYVAQHVGPTIGFVTGWTYWLNWILVGAAEITAAGLFIRYWAPDLPQWIPVAIVFLLVATLNLRGVRFFGEAEFWLALVKVVTILALIGLGITALAAPHIFQVPQASLGNLVDHGGLFPAGIAGLLLVLPPTLFAFGGVEVVALTAREAQDPQRSIPRAINGVILRILLFYIGTMVIMMSLAPWTTFSANQSPFVSTFEIFGLPLAGGIVNFVVLTAVVSAANTGLFATGRMASGLAEKGFAPKALVRHNARGLPAAGLLLSIACLAATVLLNWALPEKAFGVLMTTTGFFLLWLWCAVMIAHRNMRRALKGPVPTFRLPFYPVSNWLTLAFMSAIIVLMAITPANRAAAIAAALWFGLAIMLSALRRRRDRRSRGGNESASPVS